MLYTDYNAKYLKYKAKYLALKNMSGGAVSSSITDKRKNKIDELVQISVNYFMGVAGSSIDSDETYSCNAFKIFIKNIFNDLYNAYPTIFKDLKELTVDEKGLTIDEKGLTIDEKEYIITKLNEYINEYNKKNKKIVCKCKQTNTLNTFNYDSKKEELVLTKVN